MTKVKLTRTTLWKALVALLIAGLVALGLMTAQQGENTQQAVEAIIEMAEPVEVVGGESEQAPKLQRKEAE